MKNLTIGQRIDVFEFTYDDQDQIDHSIIKTGWQSIGIDSIGFPSIIGTDGKMHTCWSNEIKKVGTLIIKSIK